MACDDVEIAASLTLPCTALLAANVTQIPSLELTELERTDSSLRMLTRVPAGF